MVAIKPGHVAYAPEGGRNDAITPAERLRRLGFNDIMINSIRHVRSARQTQARGTQSITDYQLPCRAINERGERIEAPRLDDLELLLSSPSGSS